MYSGDMSWQDWTFAAQARAQALKNDIEQAKVLYEKWYAFSYGKTDAQVAALAQIQKAEADVTALKNAIGVFLDFYNVLHNGAALPQFDREGYLTPIL